MTVQTFFEQLALQFGIGKIKLINRRRSHKIQTVRLIVQRPNQNRPANALWDIFCGVHWYTYRRFRLHDNWRIRPKHVAFIRDVAVEVSFPEQHATIISGKRDVFYDQQEAWDRWHEVFEDLVKQLGLESFGSAQDRPSTPETSSTE